MPPTLALAVLLFVSAGVAGQPAPGDAALEPDGPLPGAVDVRPSASDEAIARRLTRILRSTGWYEDATVRVDEGVVFLSGTATSEARRAWAGDLARQTESVVAVVNGLEVPVASPWDPSLLRAELARVGRRAERAIPLVLFAILVFVLAWLAAGGVGRVVRRVLRGRMTSTLLLDLAGRLAGLPVLLLALYLVLQVSGLTRLALTLVGGTGIAALVVGIAFRDIMENFLASLLISLRQPFAVGDVVGMAGHLGVIQKVTTRGTLLMSFDGNHVQIPNATVYKSQIVNYTANPKRRMDFGVGIGYENDVARAQATALAAVKDHAAVLATPEPLVLAEALAASTVNLRIYFWYDGTEFDGLKVRSALIRAVKRALEDAGCSMPDEAREVIFPKGVPISRETPPPGPPVPEPRAAPEADATDAEGGLDAEQREIRAQALEARSPEEGEDLLASDPETSAP